MIFDLQDTDRTGSKKIRDKESTVTANTSHEGVFSTVIDLLSKNPRQLIGFMTFQLWILLVFWSPVFSWSQGKQPDSFDFLFFNSLLSNALTLAVLFIITRFINPLGRFRWIPLSACILMSIGCLLLTLGYTGLPFAQLYIFIGSPLTGIGSGCMMVLWGENLSRAKTQQAILYLVSATIIGALICYLLTQLDPLFAQCIVIVLPLISLYLFIFSSKVLPQIRKQPINIKPPLALPGKIITTSLFFGLCFGLMRGLLSSQNHPNFYLDSPLNVIAFVLAGVIVFTTAMVMKLDFRRLTYHIALPLMALGFVFVAVNGMQSFAMPVHNLGFQHFYIILWSLWAHLGSRKDLAAAWVFACGMCFLQLGQICGATFGELFVFYQPSSEALNALSLFMLFGILCMALFFLGSRDFLAGFSMIKPGIDTQKGSGEFNRNLLMCCSEIGQTQGLSDREIEVFILLAQRYKRPQICEKLVISDETVKTHIKHIYQKLNIHTREDLITIVEKELELIAPDDYMKFG